LTGYDIQLVWINKETNRTSSDFMKWPAGACRYVSCSELYNGDLFYKMLQICVVDYRTGSVRWNWAGYSHLYFNCPRKRPLPFVCLFSLILAYFSILCDCFKNVAPVSLISLWYWKNFVPVMTHSRWCFPLIRKFNLNSK